MLHLNYHNDKYYSLKLYMNSAAINPAHVNYDALHAFGVFADSLNFSHAALALHISQPALHVKIRKLSEQLDRVLYRRSGRRLELTAHGELVARFARDLRSRTAGLVEHLRTGSDAQQVVLAAGAGAYLYLLGPGIQRFRARRAPPPRLLTLDRDATVAAVRSGKAQFGVAPLETVPDGFEAQRFASVGQTLVMPRSHPLAVKRSVKLADLAGAGLIVPPADRPHRQMLSLLLQSAQVQWEVAVEASGWELMLQFVKLGLGLAVVNAYCQVPKGTVARPMPELPRLEFQLFHLRSLALEGELARLKTCLLEHRDAWKE